MSSWATKAAAAKAADGGATNGGATAAAAAAPASSAAPAAAGAAAAAGPSPALKYYLTALRGQLVVAHTVDGAAFEGLLHTLEWVGAEAAPAASGEQQQSSLVLRMAQRAATAGSPTVHPFTGVLKVPLRDLVQVLASDVSLAQWTVAYAEWLAKYATAKPAAIKNNAPHTQQRAAFATDSQISGASDKERELVRWSDDDATNASAGEDWMAGGGSSSSAGFNQFETFERMTGKTSTFKFDEYSTPLDRSSAFYKSNEARASAIANQIKASEAGSAHQRMEREGEEDFVTGDRDASEGDLFSDVRRDGAAAAAAATGGKAAYKPGAFTKKKQLNESTSPSPAKAPKLTPSASPPAVAAVDVAAVAAPGVSTTPPAVEISLAVQKKAAELAASPKEPVETAVAAAATPAPAAATPVAEASAAGSASASAVASTEGAPAAAAAAAPVKSKLNANAKSFKLSAAAPSFTPGGASSSTPVAPLAAAVPVMQPGAFMPMQPPPQLPMFNMAAQMPLGMMQGMYPTGISPQQMQQQMLRNMQQQQQQQVPQMPMAQGGQFFLPQQQQFQPQQFQPLLHPAMMAAAAAAAGMQNTQGFGMPNLQQQMRPPQNLPLFAQMQQAGFPQQQQQFQPQQFQQQRQF